VGTLYERIQEKVADKLSDQVSDMVIDQLDVDGIAEEISERVSESDELMRLVEEIHSNIVEHMTTDMKYNLDEILGEIDPEELLNRPTRRPIY